MGSEVKTTIEIAHCSHDTSKKYGYYILGDVTGKMAHFLNQRGVGVVYQRKGLLWCQDGFREATLVKKKKHRTNQSI